MRRYIVTLYKICNIFYAPEKLRRVETETSFSTFAKIGDLANFHVINGQLFIFCIFLLAFFAQVEK